MPCPSNDLSYHSRFRTGKDKNRGVFDDNGSDL